MADRMLLISWGATIPGREADAIEVFNATMGMYGRMQQDGMIESFDVVLLAPNAVMDGSITVKGSAEQMMRLKEDADFRRSVADATLVVSDLTMADGYCNEGVADQMALFTEAIERQAQTA